jgi:hypothetical protein
MLQNHTTHVRGEDLRTAEVRPNPNDANLIAVDLGGWSSTLHLVFYGEDHPAAALRDLADRIDLALRLTQHDLADEQDRRGEAAALAETFGGAA